MRTYIAGTVLALAVVSGTAGAQTKHVLGGTELARLQPDGLLVTAKLDTGADTSSLHAREIRLFERAGRTWVAFDVSAGGEGMHHFERPLIRHTLIRKGQGVKQRRPVVSMRICLGPVEREVQVSLVDRGDFNHRLLIGRNFMQGRVIVDPELEMTTAPTCVDGGAR